MTRGREADGVRRSRWWAGVGAAAVTATALLTTGCSSDDATSPSALAQAPPHATAMPLQAADGALVGPQPTGLGTVLVDGEGRTLYEFAGDLPNRPTCTGVCAQNWQFVHAPSPLPAFLPGVTGAIGSSVRPDGPQQLTIDGHPVYTFAGDVAPGQTNGQGMVVDGRVWSAVSPTGSPVQSPVAAEGPVSTPLVGIPH
jgi:predicted lipoprotein with Yx(FWY)xxD motif